MWVSFLVICHWKYKESSWTTLYIVGTYRPVIRGRSAARKTVYVCGKPRWVFVVIFLTGNLNTHHPLICIINANKTDLVLICLCIIASLVMWFSSCGLLWVLYAFLTSLFGKLFHLLCPLMEFCFWHEMFSLNSGYSSCKRENTESQGTLKHIPWRVSSCMAKLQWTLSHRLLQNVEANRAAIMLSSNHGLMMQTYLTKLLYLL